MKLALRFSLFATLIVAILMIGCTGTPTRDELINQLQIAQQEQDVQLAIRTYEQIVQYYPEDSEAPKAQFMIGYLYANEVDDTTLARQAFEMFIDNYAAISDSQLVLSARMELMTLGKGIEAYEELIFDQGGDEE